MRDKFTISTLLANKEFENVADVKIDIQENDVMIFSLLSFLNFQFFFYYIQLLTINFRDL